MSGVFNEDQLQAGRRLFNGTARFRLGVAHIEQLPPVTLVEVAFAGRSNVGKSSLINALTGVNGLARASNTPGRTRELNYFDVGGDFTLVDMPGYGFAKAAKKEVRQWQNMLKAYLRGRVGLTRAFVLIDARHGVMTPDFEMFQMLDAAGVPYQLVLTKCDKINRHELAELETETLAHLQRRAAAVQRLHLTSSERGFGIDNLRAEIAVLLNLAS